MQFLAVAGNKLKKKEYMNTPKLDTEVEKGLYFDIIGTSSIKVEMIIFIRKR